MPIHRHLTRLLATVLAVCFALPALAATPSDAQIDDLLVVMRARASVDAMLPQIESSQKQMMAQMTAGQTLTSEEQASLDRITRKTNARISDALTWEKLAPIYRDIYRQAFSDEDVDAMIGFYGSPAGQHVLDRMPQLMQQSMVAMQTLVLPLLQDMQRDIAEEAENSAHAAPADHVH